MKKILTLILTCTLFIGFSSCSDDDDKSDITTISVKAGMLAEYLANNDLSAVEKIAIKGELSYNDFAPLATLEKLTYIDLQATKIVGTSTIGVVYAENALSIDFFHDKANDGATLFPNLKTFIAPTSLTTLEDATFLNYTSLTEVRMFNKLTKIGGSVFNGCTSLKEIAIPTTVTAIGELAFYNCTALETINLPQGIQTIGRGLFGGCKSLASITLPSSVKTIGSSAFATSGLTSIVLSENITSIESNTFKNCLSLRDITLPTTLTSIASEAFAGCNTMTSITLPKNITYIGNKAFVNCSKLNQVHAQMASPGAVTEEEETIFYGIDAACILYVPQGAKTKYTSNRLWNTPVFSQIVEE